MALSFILATLGFAGLATAMGRHHRDLFGGNPSAARSAVFRVLGALLLAASYALLCTKLGVTEGTIEWLGLASLAALTTALVLTSMLLLRPRPAQNGTAYPNGIGASVPSDGSVRP
jgi:hypothetical protein